MKTLPRHQPNSPRSRALPAFAALLLIILCGAIVGISHARAQDLQAEFDAKQSKLDKVKDKKEVLTTDITSLNDSIDQLEGQISSLEDREAVVQADLDAKQGELDGALDDLHLERGRLKLLRKHLRRAIEVLSDRLVSIYESGAPDLTTILLNSDGFSDLVDRSSYLQAIQDHDTQVASRVKDLRDETQGTVVDLTTAKDRIEAARNEIAAKKSVLEATKSTMTSRQTELVSTRGDRGAALDQIEANEKDLEGDLSKISLKIQNQLYGTSVSPLAASPAGSASAAGLIWPLDGPITSGFGYRWGSLHEGIDIAVPEGTPIRAAASGTVIIAAYTGGYGNYTCVDHGGGVSTCYGHQSAYAVSAGQSVEQGQIIGYSGNTGHSTGPHLHFEVRINGVAQDPLGYL